jgi:hypothetical protein
MLAKAISTDTILFMETRAICLMGEPGREAFLPATPATIAAIAAKLQPYATMIGLYGKPPAMSAAWERIAADTGSRSGQINMDMMDIATIYGSAVAYGIDANSQLLDRIQSSRAMLRSQAHRPEMHRLCEAASAAIAKPDFKKGILTLSL